MPSKPRMSETPLTQCTTLAGCSKCSANGTHKWLTEIKLRFDSSIQYRSAGALPTAVVGTRSRAVRRGTSINAHKCHIRCTRVSGHGRAENELRDVPRRIARE